MLNRVRKEIFNAVTDGETSRVHSMLEILYPGPGD